MIGRSNKMVLQRISRFILNNGAKTIFPLFSTKIIGLRIVQTWTLWTTLSGMSLCTKWTGTKLNQNRPWLTSSNERWRKLEQQLSLKVATVRPTACIACQKMISTIYTNKRAAFCREFQSLVRRGYENHYHSHRISSEHAKWSSQVKPGATTLCQWTGVVSGKIYAWS